jgi:hypothetical protein
MMHQGGKAMAWRAIFCALAGAVAFLGEASVAGQSSTARPATDKTTATRAWTLPRTVDGQPDVQGVWNFSIGTPLERPDAFGGREFLTDAEFAQAERFIVERGSRDRRDESGTNLDVNRDYNDFWSEKTYRLRTRRTSLIVDPPDGKLPPLTPEGQRRRADRAEASRAHPFDSWVDRSLRERCLWSGLNGPPMLATTTVKESLLGASFNFRVFQGPGYVAILNEDFGELRMIPLDGRAHLPGSIRQWLGDSRGHWEATTLVVETRNFSSKRSVVGLGGVEIDDHLHLIERFSRVDADTLEYRFTIDDPTIWTKPWTAAVPAIKAEGLIYEYACHEGNYGLPNILRGARAEESTPRKGSR